MSDDQSKKVAVSIRDYCEEDKNFIYATWLRGLFYGDSWFSCIPKDIFMENYHRVLERLLSYPDTKVKVACLSDDPNVILGYSVTRNVAGIVILDWIFVKSAWRKLGIAKSLIPEQVHAVTHLTKVGKAMKPDSVIFNPFII